MILKIITEPNPKLHKKAEEIKPAILSSPKMQKFFKDMMATMYAGDGVGLAATQVAEGIRVCVIAKQYNPMDEDEDLVLINPVWEKSTILKVWDEEGCLSVPNIFGKVKRYKKIKVSALNAKGEKINFDAQNFSARVIQHEVDHLDGILFIEKAKDLHRVEDKKLI